MSLRRPQLSTINGSSVPEEEEDHNCHSDISIAVYKVLFIIIVTFKLSILNYHRLLVIQTGFTQCLYPF